MILHRRQQAAKKEEGRAKKRQEMKDQLASKADNMAVAASNADTLEKTMERMKEQLGLGARVEDLEEYEQVVNHVTQTSLDVKLAATASTPEDYLKKAAAARSALGIPVSTTENLLTGDVGISWEFEAFSQAVRSGLIYAQLSSGKVCNAQYTDALFKLTAYCTDGAVAGAAFSTLAAMLGYELEMGTVSLDPTFTSLVLSNNDKNSKNRIKIEGLPSDADLLEAFAANGYKVPDARKKPQTKEKAKKGKGEAAAAEDDDEAAAVGKKVGKKGGDNRDLPQLRIQTLKLLLHTVAAVSLHPTSATWSREGLSDLLLLSIRMQLDPEAIRLQDDSDAAIRAVLNVFEDSDWDMKLQHLANKLVLVGPGNWCRLRLLRSIPVKNHARAFALQQFTGCVLLDKIIPPKGGGTGGIKSLTARGGAADLDPMKVISSSQPWFSDPKKLVEMATSGGSGAPPRDGYLIEEVELLLRICHVLLWPHVVKKYSPLPPSSSSSGGHNNKDKRDDGLKEGLLTGEFMTAWDTFLGVILRNIKAMQVEDQAVKAFANWCQLEYKERSQGPDFMINSEEEENVEEEEDE
jgi:hypothetical protein